MISAFPVHPSTSNDPKELITVVGIGLLIFLVAKLAKLIKR